MLYDRVKSKVVGFVAPCRALVACRVIKTFFTFLNDIGIEIFTENKKTFPAIAEVAGLENSQGIDYFVGKSEWSVEEIRKRRLELILNEVKEEEIMVIIDETGDRKKGIKQIMSKDST